MTIDKNFAQILFLSCLLVCFGDCVGQTIVSAGNVSGTWTKSGSPYVVNGNIVIAPTQKLTIEPGTEVRFSGNFSLEVQGSLSSIGVQGDSIIFDRFDNQSSWHSIRLENVVEGSDSTIFEYCRIANTKYTSVDAATNGGNAVFVRNFDKVRISHCLLRNNNGGSGAGVYAENANIRIYDNVIRNNSVVLYGAGIYVNAGSPLIKGNRIEKNYGGNAAGGIWLSASESVVENNIISYNSCYSSGAGVVIANNSNSTLLRNLITYNESINDDAGGILISDSSPGIINNTIAFNKSEVGEGVLIRGSSHPQFINTIIYSNRDRYQYVNSNDEIYIESSTSNPSFYNCNIQEGIFSIVMYSGVLFPGVAKDLIEKAPVFKDPAANDFSLIWSGYPVTDNYPKSPCIDAGLSTSKYDPDGSPADIGARYFHQANRNFPPRANFQADTLLGFNSLTVAFKDISDKGSRAIIEWRWNFGDGSTSTEQNPLHEYTTEGQFDVTLTIKDESGFEKTIAREKYIRMIPGVYVKGKVSGIFDANRYIVASDLLVEEATTLEVKPGVEFMFMGQYKLEVRGALKAMGTALNPIVFTSCDTAGLILATTGHTHDPGGWAGIYVYASGAQDSTVIDHCRVQFVENNGLGAIYAFSNNGAAGMRISNSEICYNSTMGIHVFATKLIIRNNYIHHNYLNMFQKGAGIYFYAGAPKVVNNIITNNETAEAGGGMCVDWDSRPSLIGNVITSNKASRAGGICDYSGSIELINNTIAFNTSTSSFGGGYYILNAGNVTFTNNIITNNTPMQVEVADNSMIGFRNCILQGGSAAIKGSSYSVFLYENILTSDPKLVPGKNGHGRLMPGSPAVDAGISAGIMLPSFDVLGKARITNSQIDIGAYEYVPETAPVAVINPIADINLNEDFHPFTISLDDVFEYQDGRKFLLYSVEIISATKLLKAAVRDTSLYFSSIRDKFGDQIIKVTASDGNNQVTSTFALHIAPVDDTPHFIIEGDMYDIEDFIGPKSYKITSFAFPEGEENQPRTFTLEPATVDLVNIQFNEAGTLVFSARPNLFGSQLFKLTMTEGSLTHTEIFTFGLRPENDFPVITVDGSLITMKVGEEKILPVEVSDIDGDNVTLTWQTINNSISVDSNNTGLNQYNLVITGQNAAFSAVKLSATDGKLTSNETIQVSVTPIVGLDEDDLDKESVYEVYPIPTTDYINIKAKPESLVMLYNMNGQLVLQEKMGTTDLKLDFRHLAPGMYLLSINNGASKRVYRIVKQ